MWDTDYEAFLCMGMQIVLKEIAMLKDDILELKRDNAQLIANLINEIGVLKKDNSEKIDMMKMIKILIFVMISCFIVIYALK